ncbi:hypothetical protein [Arthrobacter sp. B3I4]|uniref:hypothetical protein n=1 Tax=Arthrobacter sp. B3I4 TaxID=3042267 RepID=UPI002789335B|nr:hypothetical protein [Arthrobacter sp. B3I4]MDQ0756097.1 hypothetical protein [Arthrobacter sp. B3I4]
MSDYTEHLNSLAGGDGEPCRCWTEPARVHAGHCCMAAAGQTCHQIEGLTAHQEGTQ